MAKMPKQLALEPIINANEVWRINENFNQIRAAYDAIRGDVHTKEWIYCTAGGKKWRMGSDPAGVGFLIQNLTGADWRTQSHWTTVFTISPAAALLRVVRITNADSPYTAAGQDVIFADTDGGAITVNLPAGAAGRRYRVINCGSTANNVTLTPNGAELLKGSASSQTITDGNDMDVTYEATEGWW